MGERLDICRERERERERERDDGPSGPAVCLRAGSHKEMPNVLIGVSGDGRYLTRLINQSGVKRLEALDGERETVKCVWGGVSGQCCVSNKGGGGPERPRPPASHQPTQDTH